MIGRVAKQPRLCLWYSQLRGHSSLLFWLSVEVVRRETLGNDLDQRTSPTVAGAMPLIPLLSSVSIGSCTAC
jgi:hypothetical protein